MVFGWRVGSNPVFCLVRGICRDGMDVHLTPLATVKYGPHVSSSIVFSFFPLHLIFFLELSHLRSTSSPPPRPARAGLAPLRPARAGAAPPATRRLSALHAPALRAPLRAAPTAAHRCSVRPRAPLRPPHAAPPVACRRASRPRASLRPPLRAAPPGARRARPAPLLPAPRGAPPALLLPPPLGARRTWPAPPLFPRRGARPCPALPFTLADGGRRHPSGSGWSARFGRTTPTRI